VFSAEEVQSGAVRLSHNHLNIHTLLTTQIGTKYVLFLLDRGCFGG
jgi:hypothetical protein